MTEPKTIGAVLGSRMNREHPVSSQQSGGGYDVREIDGRKARLRRIRSHEDLVQSAVGKVERLKRKGAPAWLIERERVAQARGNTVVFSRANGEWYELPLEREEDRIQRILEDRENQRARKQAEMVSNDLGVWEEEDF